MKITVIGTGYVGLVSGTCFAEMGFDVTCMDKDEGKINALKNDGVIPIYEPNLDKLVIKNIEAGRLHFTTSLDDSVPSSDAVFIAVGTPQGSDGHADLSYVFAAAKEVATHLNGYTIIVDKSTVPVGTGEEVTTIITKTNPTAEFGVVSNPEFLREGCAIDDFLKPDRIVVGASDDKAMDVMRRLYKPLTSAGHPLVETDVKTAEMIKYAANAFLATKITFINEIAALCDKLGANIAKVSEGIGLDRRIGSAFLQPGPGYGGSCFPKDTKALATTARIHNCPLPIVETVIESNERIKKAMASRIKEACGGNLSGKTIAVLGLAFKADTDDMRDAPALTIIPELEKLGAKVKAYDPEAMTEAKHTMPNITYCDSLKAALKQADAAVVLTEWAEFKNTNLNVIKDALKTPTLIDLRNIYSLKDAKDTGMEYYSLGR